MISKFIILPGWRFKISVCDFHGLLLYSETCVILKGKRKMEHRPMIGDDALSPEKTEAYPFEWLIYFCVAFTYVCMVWLCICIVLKLKRWFLLSKEV